jgi:hypothetical protein
MGLLESFVLPALAGVSLSLIAVAYRLGQPRNVTPLDLLGVCSVMGAAVFAALFVRTGVALASIPAQVWLWGVLAGLGQYAAVKMFAGAMRLGPLSPLWCMVSLGFIPTLVYSAAFLGEALRPLQYAAIAASILCVVAASAKPDPAGGPPHGLAGLPADGRAGWRTGPSGRLLYLVMLAAILLSNGVLPMSQRATNAHAQGLDGAGAAYGHLLLLLCYFTLVVAAVLDAAVTKRPRGTAGDLVLLGLLTGVGSICGLALLNACASSAIVFAIQGIVQILVVAVVSLLAFGERTSPSWYGTIVLGVLAVTLANWNAMTDRPRTAAGHAQPPAAMAPAPPG